MSKAQLLKEYTHAFERLIMVAQEAAHHGLTHQGDTWGPAEVLAHMAGWEVIATVHVPNVIAGMQPLFSCEDETQQAVLDEALNTTMVTLAADQPLSSLCTLLRRAYQQNIELLQSCDEALFQPDSYVYERTKAAIEHCQEHSEGIILSLASQYQKQGKYTEAEPLFKQALAICEQTIGPGHPHTQAVRNQYRGVQQEQQKNR